MTDDTVELATLLHRTLRARGETLAVAESLTGGGLGAALTAVPGVSEWFRGGVTAYATDLKTTLLGVDGELLERVGPVAAEVARQMATGVRERLSATYGLATTGVAGPDAQGARPPGEVHVALAAPHGCTSRSLHVPGARDRVRAEAVRAALALALEVVPGDGEARSMITALH
ncbi:MAG: CinA family protein [Actinomycetes bacterium]